MKIKKIAVLVGMGVAFSGVAQAVTPTHYYFGDVTNTSVSTADAHVGAPAGPLHDIGYFLRTSSFEDWMHFEINQPVVGTGMAFELQAVAFMDLKLTAVELWKDDAVDTLQFSLPVAETGLGSLAAGTGPLIIGNYYFKITGDLVAPAQMGAYTISASTLPVPEAETWAMMLAGLGLVGLQLRRKGKVAKEIAVN
jgi:hypothetical protein